MTAALPIPAVLDDVTPEWLTAALRASGALREAKVASVSAELIGAGEGFLGQVGRLAPTYDRPEAAAPESLVVKLASSSASTRKLALELGLYEREVRFYQELRPHVALPAPYCHAAAFEASTGRFLLLLEDLRAMRQEGQLAGARESLELAVDTLAALHAQWWESPRLKLFDWLMVWSGVPPVEGFDAAWRGVAVDCAGRLPAAAAALCERFVDCRRSLGRRLIRPPLTLLHGDYRLENMFFAAGAPRPFAIVDFQLVVQGRGGHDLAWFLCTSLDVERRRELEAEIVRRYHAGLLEGGVRDFALDACWWEYRAGVVAALWRLVYAYTSLKSSDEQGSYRQMIERAAAAVADLDGAALLADL